MDTWAAYMFRQEKDISEDEYQKYESGSLPMPANCSGVGFDGERRFLLEREHNSEFVRAANNEISDVELTVNDAIEGRPSGRLKIECFDQALIEHLTTKMQWRSALYDRSL